MYSFSSCAQETKQHQLISQEEFAKVCNNNNINSSNYTNMTKIYKKLPSWAMIDFGYYNGKTFSVVLNKNIVSIDF